MFLPVKSVGVTGDGRRHEPVIALRAVETVDFMTAHWAHLPYELLDVCSRRIVNEVKGISRVVYDITGGSRCASCSRTRCGALASTPACRPR